MPSQNLIEQLKTVFHEADLKQLENAWLILGISGVGKSLFIAYLLGCELAYEAEDLIVKRCPPGVVPPKIGLSTHAETLIPAVYGGCIVDFAGFYGNRDQQTNLLEFLATQRGIHSCKSIQSVTSLMDFRFMRDHRSNAMMLALDVMAAAFKNINPEHYPSLFLVISHLPKTPVDKTKVIHRLRKLLNDISSKIETPSQQAVADVLRYWVNEGQDHVLLFDPMHDVTRRAFFAAQPKGISLSPLVFDLMGASEIQETFLHQIQEPLLQGQTIFDVLLSAKQNEAELKATIQQLQAQLIKEQNAAEALKIPSSPKINSVGLQEIQSLIDRKIDEIKKLDPEQKYTDKEADVFTDLNSLEKRTEQLVYDTKVWNEKEARGTTYATDPVYNARIIRVGPPFSWVYRGAGLCHDGTKRHIEVVKSIPAEGYDEVIVHDIISACYGLAHLYYYRPYNEGPEQQAELDKLRQLAGLINAKSKLEQDYQDCVATEKVEQQKKDADAYQEAVQAETRATQMLKASNQALQAHQQEICKTQNAFIQHRDAFETLDHYLRSIHYVTPTTTIFHQHLTELRQTQKDCDPDDFKVCEADVADFQRECLKQASSELICLSIFGPNANLTQAKVSCAQPLMPPSSFFTRFCAWLGQGGTQAVVESDMNPQLSQCSMRYLGGL